MRARPSATSFAIESERAGDPAAAMRPADVEKGHRCQRLLEFGLNNRQAAQGLIFAGTDQRSTAVYDRTPGCDLCSHAVGTPARPTPAGNIPIDDFRPQSTVSEGVGAM